MAICLLVLGWQTQRATEGHMDQQQSWQPFSLDPAARMPLGDSLHPRLQVT